MNYFRQRQDLNKIKLSTNVRLKQDVADPLHFDADPNPPFQFDADPDPLFLTLSDKNLRPLVYKESPRLHFEPLRLHYERLRPSTALIWDSIDPELRLWCGSGSCFWLLCIPDQDPDPAFHSDADPDPASQMMRIRIWLHKWCRSMRITIHNTGSNLEQLLFLDSISSCTVL